MKKIYNVSLIYLVLGLASGIYYRELTKINDFHNDTVLSVVHTHFLVLGFVFFLIVLLLAKVAEITKVKGFNTWFYTYNISLVYTVVLMIIRGTAEVQSINIVDLSHIAGLGHMMLGLSLIWFMVSIKKYLLYKH